MKVASSIRSTLTGVGRPFRWLYRRLAPRAHTAIMWGALVCTLGAKLYHSLRYDLLGEYAGWIGADIAVLLGLDLAMTLVCRRWPRRWVLRAVMSLAAVTCTWSVLNAGWIVRTGTQMLPGTLLPLFRDPVNAFGIIGDNIAKHPWAALVLLGPSALALAFFFLVMARPALPPRRGRLFSGGTVAALLIVLIAIPAGAAGTRPAERPSSSQVAASGLRYNSQLKALATVIFPDESPLTRSDFENASRRLPLAGEATLAGGPGTAPNVLMVVLEGVQRRYTSLDPQGRGLTEHLASMAAAGTQFSEMRSVFTHTSKALFALQTGRIPSISQDVVEAVPSDPPFMSLATLLRDQGYRTAFFQSARGDFESRPSLVANLGFEIFFARDDLDDPNTHVAYLAADEFALLDPLRHWVEADDRPFFLTVLCSVTHDPYVVPSWYGEPVEDPIERYRQVIRYTDSYLEALDDLLTQLGQRDTTLVCVVSDHGEAFGEHGKQGHDQIGFDEVLRVPWVLRGPGIPAGRVCSAPVSSIDVAPTLLAAMGYAVEPLRFDGLDALGPVDPDRRIYFSCWNYAGPAGYVQAGRKVIFTPSTDLVVAYDLQADPQEQTPLLVGDVEAERIQDEIVAWKRKSLLKPAQGPKGSETVFGRWTCRWAGRDPRSRYTETPVTQ